MPPIAVLVALADPTRCRIIEILQEGPKPVHVVAGAFKISRPAISRHLRVLKQAKLISEKKSGRENLYALHAGKLKPVVEWLAAMQRKQGASLAVETVQAPPPEVTLAKPKAAKTAKVSRIDPGLPPSAAPVSQMGFDF